MKMLEQISFLKKASRCGRFAAAVLAIAAIGPGGAARGQSFTEFAIPTANSFPLVIAAGPDGNLWFTENDGNKIGRITPAGVITEFTIPTANSAPKGVAAGPDGNLWFTEYYGNKIGRITPAGVITEFAIPTAGSAPNDVAVGQDGNLWFTEYHGNRIGRITTTGAITEFTIPTADSYTLGIAGGPDGNLWFTEALGNKIGRITTAGVITEFANLSFRTPHYIVAGPDGNLWFTEEDWNAIADHGDKIARITTAGVITEFTILYGQPWGIVAGPDGNLWFADLLAGIGRITTGGVVTEFRIPTGFSVPSGIATGPDGNLWFTESGVGKIGRLNLSALCAPSATSLCLNDARFKVEAAWTTSDGASGSGQAVGLTPDAGYFWFFSTNNPEVLIKALNGCSFNNRNWIFAAGLTNVTVVLKVTDTQTGQVKTYSNPQGTAFQPIQDTNAFACP